MITVRPSSERGIGGQHLSWLESRHSFSFGEYFDENHMGFASVRVINEDQVAPEGGFATHPHQNMEIVSYVISGELEHKDSMGNGSIIKAGDVQRMSAGTGVTHSEFNPSATNPVHFLQIWFLPKKLNIEPSYQQQHFPVADKQGKLKLVVSEQGSEDSLSINQDLNIYASVLNHGEQVEMPIQTNRAQWIQVVKGELVMNDTELQAGDGAAVVNEGKLQFKHSGNQPETEFVLFDMQQPKFD